jgi:hypothetical protein
MRPELWFPSATQKNPRRRLTEPALIEKKRRPRNV